MTTPDETAEPDGWLYENALQALKSHDKRPDLVRRGYSETPLFYRLATSEDYSALLHQAEEAGFGTVGELIAYLRDEIAEQARVNGMGSEREAALMGEIARLREGVKAFLPRNICLTNRNVPDSVKIPLAATMGELRALAALGERQP